MALQLALHDTAQRMRQFYALTKPRVTLLAVFCAGIGMFLATPGMVPWRVLFAGVIGGIGMFLYYAIRIYTAYSDRLVQQTFRHPVVYLAALFTALLLDHYV